MKKISILAIILLMVAVLPSAFAEELAVVESRIAPMPPADNNAFGQSQFYSVIFDEEGDAIVGAKLKVQNTGKENLTELKLEIAGKSVRIVNMFQEVQKQDRVCSYWEKICVEYDEETDTCSRFKEKCSNWYNQPQWPPFYYTINRTAEQLSKSVKYTLELPSAITEQSTVTILIYYKVEGYVDKGFGSYDFDFETIKQNQDINQIRVSVNVQEGLYLKGGEAKVDYRSGFGGFASAEKAAPMAEGIQSQDLQMFSNQIEWQTGYVKTAQGLDPLESFHVKGEYGTSWISIHKLGLILGIIVFGLVIGGIVMAFKKVITSSKESFMIQFGIGSGAAILLLLNWILFSYIIKNINSWVGYQYGQLIALLLVLLAGIITLALLVGPALYVGFTSGVKNAFIVIGIQVVVLVVLSIIVVILLAVMNQSSPPIIYRAMAEAVSAK